MTEKMNPPPLGIERIRELEELKRILGVHLKHETDASNMWNEYVWSYAVDFYKLFYEHYSTFTDFVDHAVEAAQHNAVVSTIEVIGRQLYNFNSLRPSYERQIFERLSEHVRREEMRLKPAPILMPPLGALPRATPPPPLLPEEDLASRRRAFVQPILHEKGWSILDWAN